MGRSKEHLGSEIVQAGECLLALLRQSLCPEFVRDADAVALAAPWDAEDYRVGVYLYDIQDFSICQPVAVESENGQRFPPKAVELSYLIFCNEKQHFGGLRREGLHAILNEVLRAVYDHPLLSWEGGGAAELTFLRESEEFKIRLWGSFQQPLQPAVYLRAAPVLVTSRTVRQVHAVKERDYRTEWKQ